ncbi:SecDF P1 head subdomain-containing protein [Streptomyces milbemycinicus]|uniref:SecDF P1 head subdomain-containing protein n=1 Tax=Streptomyces milbemycinicus TaxID=476552 RepID=UPI0033E796D2
MRTGWVRARGVAVAGLLLTASAATGCDDGGSDGAGERGGAIGGAFDPPKKAPSAPEAPGGGGGEGGGAAGGVVSGPPVKFLPVEREEPGPCPSGAADAYTDTPTGKTGQTSGTTSGGATPGGTTSGGATEAGQSCLYVDPDGGMTVRRTESAKATFDTQYANGFIVTIGLAGADAARFGELTGKLAKEQPPRNRLAMVRGDKLLSAPSVASAIPGGKVQITGSFDRDEAEQLARDLGGG